MSASVNPAIQRLDFDILWHVFDMNADIFEDGTALRTTLAASRVCRDWRSLLLSSTSIWAHVIDLNHSLWNSVEGSQEILQRSGAALMWIKSSSYYRLKQSLHVVETNWGRIQKFKLGILTGDVNQWRVALCRPAPHLESFNIDFVHVDGRFITLVSSLFGGSAPMMRDFRLRAYRGNVPTLSWLKHLRAMELTGTHTVPQILGVLASTANLTNLRLGNIEADNSVLTLTVVSLPKLAHLVVELSHKITTGIVLLEHLLIPPSCTVAFSVDYIDRREVNKKSNFEPIFGVISTCAQRCFAHHLPRHLHVVITSSSFTLRTTDYCDAPSFMFCMGLIRTHMLPGYTLRMFLRGFSSPYLSKVTYFAFRITGIPRQVPELTTFIATLPSVETISTEELSLRHLRAYSPPKGGKTVRRIVFPALKTLRLVSFVPPRELWCKFDKVRDPVSKYVMARIARGQPISTVEYTPFTLDECLPYMAFLRKADGLKVLWQRRGVAEPQVYICGTCGPQKLVGFAKYITPKVIHLKKI